MTTRPKRKRTRRNGAGSLFRRKPNGPWIASWYTAEGTRRERSTRTTSRTDAERLLRGWTERVVLEREGLVAPEGGTELDRHARAPLETHLSAFEAAKRAEGRTDRHIAGTLGIIREAATGCGWKALGDFDAEALERFIGRKRAPAKPTTTKAGAADDESKPRAWSPRTAHKCVTALRTFLRWCVADGRLAADPLARVRKTTPTRQRTRRMLTPEEWRWLRHATEAGPERMGMPAGERSLLYRTAIETGLRSTELRALIRTSLFTDGERPYILLGAASTKNGKSARQFVRPELARDLARHVARAMPGAPVFATMPRREHCAAMLRADLQAAREAWIADAGADAAERVKREQSDFLAATDHDGRIVDFHALRYTTGAWAAMGGASPQAIKRLMRHSSITLTMDTYGALCPSEDAETVHRMPSIEAVALRMTGTDDDAPEAPAVGPAVAGRIEATRGNPGRNKQPRNPAGEPGNAVFKRGGRDSNPQPPDRQSTGRIAQPATRGGLARRSRCESSADRSAPG
jgi:integrase